MPSGSLVTGFQKRILPNGCISPEIIFWERNGLRHGEFVLPKAQDDSKTDVRNLSYNLESVLLAVHCVIDDQEQVLLYTRSNWKWYCKQQILIDPESPLLNLFWVKKQQMCLIYQTGTLEFVEYNFTYHSSMTNFNHVDRLHDGYMAVVDGPAINLTPLGRFVMPPPMFEKQVTGLPSVPSCISLYGHQGVAFCETNSQLCFFDCGAADGFPVYLTLEHGKDQRVVSLLNFSNKEGEQMILVQLGGALVDTLDLLRVELGDRPSLTKVTEFDLGGKI